MLWPVNPYPGKTTNWRAVCGKSACTVRREGEQDALPTPIQGVSRILDESEPLDLRGFSSPKLMGQQLPRREITLKVIESIARMI